MCSSKARTPSCSEPSGPRLPVNSTLDFCTSTHHLAAPFAARAGKRTGRASPTLSDRETEVLRFVAQGHSNKEIAARLDLSTKTIEVHKANAMRKLGLAGRIELLQDALHVGWLHEA